MPKEIQAKTILNKFKKRDDWFLCSYSLNPFLGCTFNCIYCYIRGSKYGENMKEGFKIKINAPELLEKALSLRSKKEEYGYIALSSATDPYVPIEKEIKLTQRLLKIILKYRFPVSIATKSTLITRDLSLLKKIDQEAILPSDLKSDPGRGTIISFSLSTVDERLAKLFEPGAPSPKERLETLKKCKEKGFFVGVNFIPVLPYLSDSEKDLDLAIKRAKEYGADYVLVGGLTLFGNGPTDCKTLYYRVLKKHFPELLPKYQKIFDKYYGMSWNYQKKLDQVAKRICQQYKIKYRIIE